MTNWEEDTIVDALSLWYASEGYEPYGIKAARKWAKAQISTLLSQKKTQLLEAVRGKEKDDLEKIGGLDNHDGGHFIMGYNESLTDVEALIEEIL